MANGDIDASAVLAKFFREHKKINAPKLARMLDVSIASVYFWKQGKQRVSALRVRSWVMDPKLDPVARALAQEIQQNGKRE